MTQKNNDRLITEDLFWDNPILERYRQEFPIKLTNSRLLDKVCGIDYVPSLERITGQIKVKAEDFIVREILPDGRILPVKSLLWKYNLPGEGSQKENFIHGILIKKNYETFSLIEKIARKTGINENNIFIAGLKDKKAITVQRICIRNSDINKVRGIKQGRLCYNNYYEIRSPVYRNQGLYWGDLKGNAFEIKIRNIQPAINPKKLLRELSDRKIPNFFDRQRFGWYRPISHIIGWYMMKGSLLTALLIYIGLFITDEGPLTEIRKRFVDDSNYQTMMQRLDDNGITLKWERRLLKYLQKYKNRPEKAIYSFPRNLFVLYYRSVGSYIFNRYLSERFKHENSFSVPIEGEKVIGGRIFAPVLGTNTIPEIKDTTCEDIILKILEEEKLCYSDFLNGSEKSRKVITRGSWRPINQEFRIKSIKLLPGKFKRVQHKLLNVLTLKRKSKNINHLKIVFELTKGSYATILLKEFLAI